MVRKVLELLITKTRDILYDVRHRVRTRGVVPVAELGLTRDSIQYEGIAPKTLRKALASLGPLDGYTFIDLGSGMGRAVLVASEFPFRRIVGVEIAPELHAIAARNLRRYRGRQRCRDIHLVQLDALCYEPAGEETVFFFNFPFREAFMTRVIGNIERSLDDASAAGVPRVREPGNGPCRRSQPRLRAVHHRQVLPHLAKLRASGPEADDASCQRVVECRR